MSIARSACLSAWILSLGLLGGCSGPNPPPSGTTVLGTANANYVSEQEAVSQTFAPGATPRVVVDLFLGGITITAGGEDKVQVEVTKQAAGETREEAKENLKKIDVKMTAEGNVVRVTATRLPDFNNLNASASAKLQVPPGSSLELKTALGAVSSTGVLGDISVTNSNGAVMVKGGKGTLRLSSNLAPIETEGEHRAVTVRNSNGAVHVRGATGPIDLTTTLGKVEADAPSPSVKVHNSNGAVVVRRATGRVDVTTSLGPIDVNAPCGDVTAGDSNGAVTVRGARGKLDLRTSLGQVEVDAPSPDVAVHNSNGAVVVRGATGRVDVQTSLSPITVEAPCDSVRAKNSNGVVTVKGARGSLDVHTSLGNIAVTLPADARFSLDAQTNLGTVTCGFPLQRTDGSKDKHLVGTAGKNPDAGKPDTVVKLVTSNGNISIEPGK